MAAESITLSQYRDKVLKEGTKKVDFSDSKVDLKEMFRLFLPIVDEITFSDPNDESPRIIEELATEFKNVTIRKAKPKTEQEVADIVWFNSLPKQIQDLTHQQISKLMEKIGKEGKVMIKFKFRSKSKTKKSKSKTKKSKSKSKSKSRKTKKSK